MNEHQCDRCGATKRTQPKLWPSDWSALYATTDSGLTVKLCPSCTESFDDWMRGPPHLEVVDG